ncbi:MAG TPA: alpha/beta fold hydrolase [Anaerolineales bacterium]|nr:alpha/beta fold hydrolase [Anaerolineales bacterium]
METIDVNGIRLAYDRRGKGTPMVLLHGFPLDHHLWDGVVPLLEDQFDLIVPDLRGFGGSSTVDSFYSMEDYASDVAALLDHLGIPKAAIVGHSMGGYVALAFARLFPDRVSGLGLVSSQVLDDAPERKEGRYKSAAEVADKGISSVVETMTPKFTSDTRLQEYARTSMEKQQPAAYIGALKAMAERVDSTPLLSTISYPVVLIHGDADSLIPVDRAREVKASFPQSHFVEIRGAGHIPMMEAKEQTAEALRNLA